MLKASICLFTSMQEPKQSRVTVYTNSPTTIQVRIRYTIIPRVTTSKANTVAPKSRSEVQAEAQSLQVWHFLVFDQTIDT